MGAFHAYDIRGIWDKEITVDFAYRLGRAFAAYSRAETVLVAHDARLHSRELSQRLVDGLTEAGVDVTDLGLASTPQMHFYQLQQKAAAGVMVTASHNPKEYHGFKFYDRVGGGISYDKGLQRVEELMQKPPARANGKTGRRAEKKMIDEYIEFVAGDRKTIALPRPVVIDTANGSGGPVLEALVRRLGLNAVLRNTRPDGNFPGHDPNPLKEDSRREARQAVLDNGAPLGAVLDGDGDRIIFIDDTGEAVENYFMSALIAGEILAAHPGASIAYDLISSRALPEYIREAGGKPVVSRVGYTFLYDRMVESGALYGAETSGHVYFRVSEKYYSESAAYALVMVLDMLAKNGRPLSELLKPLRARYAQAPEMNVKVKDKQKALALVEQKFNGGKVDKLDGVSVTFDDYWFNVRPSNTEPLLRMRLEARDKATALAKADELKHLLEST